MLRGSAAGQVAVFSLAFIEFTVRSKHKGGDERVQAARTRVKVNARRANREGECELGRWARSLATLCLALTRLPAAVNVNDDVEPAVVATAERGDRVVARGSRTLGEKKVAGCSRSVRQSQSALVVATKEAALPRCRH